MYTTLINKIQETLEKIDSISKIYSYPATKLEGYPAVVFRPSDFENSFSSNAENFKIYKFLAWIIVSAESKSMKDVFETILPTAVDDVVAQFDEDWNGGTIDGHRCWIIVDNGIWATDSTEDGQTAYAELNITIKITTDN